MVTDHFREYLFDIEPDYVVRYRWMGLGSESIAGEDLTDRKYKDPEQGYYVFLSHSSSGMIRIAEREAELSFYSNQPENDVEYFLRIVLSFALCRMGGFLFHASGVIHNNKAYIFFGKSGSGKTTVAKNSPGDIILSDDLVGILPSNGGVVAYSTPFWNPGWTRQIPHSADVDSFYRLVQDDIVNVNPMRQSLAITEIMASIPVVPIFQEFAEDLTSIIQRITTKVGVYYLHFTQDGTFWGAVDHIGRRK